MLNKLLLMAMKILKLWWSLPKILTKITLLYLTLQRNIIYQQYCEARKLVVIAMKYLLKKRFRELLLPLQYIMSYSLLAHSLQCVFKI
jgi:hypothetical protein